MKPRTHAEKGMAHRRMAVLACGSVTALTLTVLPAPAHAGEITVMGTYQNLQTGLCLDGNARGELYTSLCSPDNAYQRWIFTYSGTYQNTIRQVATGRCLVLASGNGSSTFSSSCENRPEYRWLKDGDFRRSGAHPDKCLDSNWAHQVYSLACNGGRYQRWQLNVISKSE